MKLTVYRSIPLVLALDVAALLVSGIGRYKNATHGVDYVIGEADWLGFLVGALTLLVLIAVAVRRHVEREDERDRAVDGELHGSSSCVGVTSTTVAAAAAPVVGAKVAPAATLGLVRAGAASTLRSRRRHRAGDATARGAR